MRVKVLMVAAALLISLCGCTQAVGNNLPSTPDSSSAQSSQSLAPFPSEACSLPSFAENEAVSEQTPQPIENEMRGIWIAFFELYPMFDGDFAGPLIVGKLISGVTAVAVAVLIWRGKEKKNG